MVYSNRDILINWSEMRRWNVKKTYQRVIILIEIIHILFISRIASGFLNLILQLYKIYKRIYKIYFIKLPKYKRIKNKDRQ